MTKPTGERLSALADLASKARRPKPAPTGPVRKTSRPVPTALHKLLHEACPTGSDGEASIRATLAPALGVSYQYVYRWIEANRIPAKFVKQLVEVANGRVTQDQLIPFVI